MTCRTARLKIGPYLDGQLPEAESRGLHAHLSSCGACRQVLAEVQYARDALRRSSSAIPPVPPDLCSRIKGALLVAEEERTIVESSNTPPVGSPAFVATCASLFIGAIMFYVVATHFYPGVPGDEESAPAEVVVASAQATSPGPRNADAPKFAYLSAGTSSQPATPAVVPVLTAAVAGASLRKPAASRMQPPARVVRARSAKVQRVPAVASRPAIESAPIAETAPGVAPEAPCFAFADTRVHGPAETAGRRAVTATGPRPSAVSFASNTRRDEAALSSQVFDDPATLRPLRTESRFGSGSTPSLAGGALPSAEEGLP